MNSVAGRLARSAVSRAEPGEEAISPEAGAMAKMLDSLRTNEQFCVGVPLGVLRSSWIPDKMANW